MLTTPRILRCWPALLLALSSSVAYASIAEPTRLTLANGLRVVLAPDSLASALDVSLWFGSGIRHETPAQAGLALLTARLTFRNGESDPLAALSAEGGTGGVTVTPDLTCFSATMPEEGLGAALAFLAERLPGRPTNATELAAERAALRGDLARSERTPIARGLASLWAAAWPGHPYARNGAPPAAGADALTATQVEAWRRAYYSPGNAVLTVAGAFDRDRSLAEIRQRFERLPRGAAGTGSRPGAPRAAARSSASIELPARLCLMGWRGPGAADPDTPALELLAAWLGDGSQARLSSSLVRFSGLALGAQAGFIPEKEGSLLWSVAVVAPGADSAAVERALLDAAREVTEHAPEAFEVERARRRLEAARAFDLQTARQRGQWLGEAEMLAGDAATATRWLDALGRVTPDDLRRVAARVMTDAARATVWLLPAGAGGAR